MKTTIKNSAIFALSTLMLVGCSSTSNSPTSTSEVASSTSTEQETETIELTIDNWQDYLEMKEDYGYYYDDFDEINTMYKAYYFYLKDGMTFAEDSEPEVAIEYEYDYNYYTFSNVDWINGTFDYGELFDVQSFATDHISETATLTRNYDKKTEEYTTNIIGYIKQGEIWFKNGETTSDVDFDENFQPINVIEKHDNLTITRIQGTIEVVK